MFLDVDHFKRVNDNLGHQAGDRLLVEVARRLETLLRPSDVIGRGIGGDEFAAVLPDLSTEGEAHPDRRAPARAPCASRSTPGTDTSR